MATFTVETTDSTILAVAALQLSAAIFAHLVENGDVTPAQARAIIERAARNCRSSGDPAVREAAAQIIEELEAQSGPRSER